MLIGLGVVLLATQVFMPLVFFKSSPAGAESVLAGPMNSTVLGTASGFKDFSFDELGSEDERTGGKVLGDAAAPTATSKEDRKEIPEFFTISVPKLKIENAVVETNAKNLSPDESLGHYKGSGLPGEPGNAFIYGHSVLPFFYNPKNYKTIFSTLGNLETGDEIIIEYDGERIVYVVETKEVLAPEKIDPLAEFKPKYLNEPTLELMTCWPAGTKSKRLLVRAVAR